jgi:hypothetical protein
MGAGACAEPTGFRFGISILDKGIGAAESEGRRVCM